MPETSTSMPGGSRAQPPQSTPTRVLDVRDPREAARRRYRAEVGLLVFRLLSPSSRSRPPAPTSVTLKDVAGRAGNGTWGRLQQTSCIRKIGRTLMKRRTQRMGEFPLCRTHPHYNRSPRRSGSSPPSWASDDEDVGFPPTILPRSTAPSSTGRVGGGCSSKGRRLGLSQQDGARSEPANCTTPASGRELAQRFWHGRGHSGRMPPSNDEASIARGSVAASVLWSASPSH